MREDHARERENMHRRSHRIKIYQEGEQCTMGMRKTANDYSDKFVTTNG